MGCCAWQTYEGGLAGEPGNEAHGGYAFCGVAALALLGRLDALDVGCALPDACCLLHATCPSLSKLKMKIPADEASVYLPKPILALLLSLPLSMPQLLALSVPSQVLSFSPFAPLPVRPRRRLLRWSASCQGGMEGGFMGRTNKLVDGCYSWWQVRPPGTASPPARRASDRASVGDAS